MDKYDVYVILFLFIIFSLSILGGYELYQIQKLIESLMGQMEQFMKIIFQLLQQMAGAGKGNGTDL